jgi:hypothetical protein
MELLKYKKEDLVKIITSNRNEHKGFFDKACGAFREAVIEELERSLVKAKKGKWNQGFIQFVVPVEHLKDYDRVLKMLSLTVEEFIELDEQNFAAYVLDDWSWKRQFLDSNSTYMVK